VIAGEVKTGYMDRTFPQTLTGEDFVNVGDDAANYRDEDDDDGDDEEEEEEDDEKNGF